MYAVRLNGELVFVDRITRPSVRGICLCRRQDTGAIVEIPAPFLISI